MSLNTGLIMIKGNHLDRLEQVFDAFKYRWTGRVRQVDDWDDAWEAMRPDPSPGVVRHAVLVHNGWTIILDYESVLWTDEEACREVSQKLQSRVFAMSCAGVASSYAYRLWEGTRVRKVWWEPSGGIFENEGEPLPEEEGIDFNLVGEEEVLMVMERLSVDYSELQEVEAFQVVELDRSSLLAELPATNVAEPQAAPPPKKAWWKFWQ
jgi:hypothetical protein